VPFRLLPLAALFVALPACLGGITDTDDIGEGRRVLFVQSTTSR
jgi:hypothetical protein